MAKHNHKLSAGKCFKLAAAATCCYISYKSPLGLSASIAFVGLTAASKVPSFFGISLISMPALLVILSYTAIGTLAPLVSGPKYPERKISYSEARMKALADLCTEVATNGNTNVNLTNTFSFSKGLAHTLSWSTNYDNYVDTHNLVIRPANKDGSNIVKVVQQNSVGKTITPNSSNFEIVEQNSAGRPIATNTIVFAKLER